MSDKTNTPRTNKYEDEYHESGTHVDEVFDFARTLEREVNELAAALERINELTNPGQEMGLPTAIDCICDVWNVSKANLAKVRK